MTSELEGIAIIGMAGRFPQSQTLEQFWQHLTRGNELISFFSAEELIQEGIPLASIQNASYIKAKGMLSDIDCFDAEFFGFNPREAALMDPQQRVLLECAWEALENAGYDPEQYLGSIGVFVGSSLSSYFLFNLFPLLYEGKSQEEMMMVIGNEKDFLASRISYKLNLKGPSKVVQTACSTSLSTVHDAYHHLLSYQCDLALAGGISITTPQRHGYFYTKEGINSPDGHCRAFDAKAEGTVHGNGGGLVVLKRLEEAVEDGDHIFAVIKGSAINNDGHSKVGYTAPSIEGQVRVITAAHIFSNIHPETISYVEAHGTGTILGDPIEISALTQAFRSQTQAKHFCAIGSVKTNIGHLDAAAGIAGLIKTVLSLKHRQLPPSLHFETPNPKIDFHSSPFFVNTQLREWKSSNYPLRAGVSSFGIGGTNVHMVLEEAPSLSIQLNENENCYLFPFSAPHPEALKTILQNFYEKLPSLSYGLGDIAYTLQVGRKGFNYRIYFTCAHKEQLLQSINYYLVHGRKTNTEFTSLENIGTKWMQGEKIDWNSLYKVKRRRVPLPSYPFARKKYWVASSSIQKASYLQKAEIPTHVSSEDQVENWLQVCWQKAFDMPHISVDDNYFQCGGDSLMAIEIAGQIKQRLYVDISIQDFFNHPTIRSLSVVVKDRIMNKMDHLSEEETKKILEQIAGT